MYAPRHRHGRNIALSLFGPARRIQNRTLALSLLIRANPSPQDPALHMFTDRSRVLLAAERNHPKDAKMEVNLAAKRPRIASARSRKKMNATRRVRLCV